jgi:hypothetical protein
MYEEAKDLVGYVLKAAWIVAGALAPVIFVCGLILLIFT